MKTILVADDDENIRLLLETELSLQGYQVVLANNGLEALTKIKDRTPDLLILDIKMPDMHGLEVLDAIRKENKKFSIIICSAYEEMRHDYTIWASRVAGFITKPIDLDKLGALVEKSLADKIA